MSKPVTILIADDHPIFRRGLRDVVKEEPSVQLLGEAVDGAEALRLVGELMPQVLVLDHDMPKLNGLQVAQAVRRQKLEIGLVMLTMFKEERLFNEAMDAGFLGYVLKENAASDLIECIHAVAAGRAFISPVLSSYLLQRSARVTALTSEKPGLDKLTPSERRILKLIAADFTSKEIAEQLGVSFHTVENHRSNISAKLGLSGSHSLLKFAFENKSSL
jgi:DNA-binding NarL/FixJ family response regulator